MLTNVSKDFGPERYHVVVESEPKFFGSVHDKTFDNYDKALMYATELRLQGHSFIDGVHIVREGKHCDT
jgi:hypothetical protein